MGLFKIEGGVDGFLDRVEETGAILSQAQVAYDVCAKFLEIAQLDNLPKGKRGVFTRIARYRSDLAAKRDAITDKSLMLLPSKPAARAVSAAGAALVASALAGKIFHAWWQDREIHVDAE